MVNAITVGDGHSKARLVKLRRYRVSAHDLDMAWRCTICIGWQKTMLPSVMQPRRRNCGSAGDFVGDALAGRLQPPRANVCLLPPGQPKAAGLLSGIRALA